MYVGLAQRALDLWRELEHDADETLLVTTGGLDAGPMGTLDDLGHRVDRPEDVGDVGDGDQADVPAAELGVELVERESPVV